VNVFFQGILGFYSLDRRPEMLLLPEGNFTEQLSFKCLAFLFET
jgi:hypothetical protein